MTNEEQIHHNKKQLSEQLLKDKNKKYKVVFFCSGSSNLLKCTENLLVHNINS